MLRRRVSQNSKDGRTELQTLIIRDNHWFAGLQTSIIKDNRRFTELRSSIAEGEMLSCHDEPPENFAKLCLKLILLEIGLVNVIVSQSCEFSKASLS
ncbi:hypothetical protein ACH5RR_014897 [Cinchona calisaya]|uniref:Uncharacterized protein n=1 Tax=Cinchona calisaya TaxID=153742 RepID=A0ABD2ZWV3_9GENT